jgi:hypothetical protein
VVCQMGDESHLRRRFIELAITSHR